MIVIKRKEAEKIFKDVIMETGVNGNAGNYVLAMVTYYALHLTTHTTRWELILPSCTGMKMSSVNSPVFGLHLVLKL